MKELKSKKNKKNAGFTLIEVVAVTAMLGVLTAMLIPSINGANDRTRNAKLKSDLATLDQAIQIYKLDKGAFPGTLDVLVPDYVAKNSGFLDAQNTTMSYSGSGTTYSLKGKNAAGEEVVSDGSESKQE